MTSSHTRGRRHLEHELARTEAALRAVLAGEVDAITVPEGAVLLRQSQAALRASEGRFRAVFETALDAIAMVDDEGRYVEVNPAACALLGRPREELIGRSIVELSSPDLDFETTWNEFRRGGTSRGEWRLQHADGTERHVEYSATACFLPGLHLSIMRDVTEQRRTLRELHASREMLQAVLDNIPQLVFWKDPAGRYLGFNRALREQMGLAGSDDVVGLTDEAFPWAEDAESYRAEDRQVMESGVPLQVEKRINLGSERRWIVTRKVPFRDGAGRVMGVLGCAEDVTDRKRAEQAQRDKEEILRGFFDSRTRMRGIVELTDDGDILHVFDNAATAGLFGTTPETMSGRRASELGTPPNIVATWAEHYRESERTGEPVTFEYPHAPAGRFFSVTVSPVGRGPGGRTRFAYVVEDVTEQRHLEQQYQQAQKMEAMGRLAGGVAHDFNNLLAVIMGYGEIALRRTPEGDPLRPRLNEIVRAAERAAGLTRQLLAFSRNQPVQPRVLDPNAVVRDIEKMLRRLIGEDVELKSVLDPHIGRVKADAGQLEQVIINLAVNARDAMPEGGSLTIETRNVEVTEDLARSLLDLKPGPHLLLAVSDTGTGMDAQTISYIFEPFFTTKEAGRGTGLGLATVFAIVRQSGGRISVYSEPGRGTTFKIYLPRVDQPVEPKTTASPLPAPRGSERVLVVEDDAMLRALVRESLESSGYLVDEAADPADALRLAEEHRGELQLLVTDVVMPRMSGRDVAREVKARCPDVRVLFMSGYTDAAVVHHGRIEPDAGFLQKPFTPDVLAAKVRETLDAPR